MIYAALYVFFGLVTFIIVSYVDKDSSDVSLHEELLESVLWPLFLLIVLILLFLRFKDN